MLGETKHVGNCRQVAFPLLPAAPSPLASPSPSPSLPRSPSPSPSPSPPPTTPDLVLTLAQAFGPNSATATAAGAANVTWARWQFTATPGSGAAITQESDTPLVFWYSLAADMPCECGWGVHGFWVLADVSG